MYQYTKDMYPRLKYKFLGAENIEKNYSQSLQDMFVLGALKGKRVGSFLEIGAFHPTFISNTYLLESDFGWGGLSVDKEPSVMQAFYNRRAEFVLGDAVELNWDVILSRTFGGRIDYLSLDIEPNSQTLACLKKLPLDKFRFSVITYETDFYDPNTEYSDNYMIRRESREIFRRNGYTLVAGNLSNLDDSHPFEDWYLDNTYFNEDWVVNFLRLSEDPLAAHKYMLYER